MGIRIVLNGRPHELDGEISVAELLVRLDLPASQVAVERNGHVVKRALHAETILADGDALEVVTFVGGG